MTYPTAAVNTANVGASGDSPASARSDILDGIQKLNQMIAHTTAFAATLLDDIDAATARGTLEAAKSGANTDIVSLDGVLVGKGAGSIATNTRYGAGALTANTTGYANAVFGYEARKAGTTGSFNSSFGSYALSADTVGSGNSAFGCMTALGINSGNNNSGFGLMALKDCTTGNANLMLAPYGQGVGYYPVFNITTQDNRISMGSTAVTNAYIQVAWTVVSDARDKTNFAPVPHGLSFVNALRPTAYQFKVSRDDDTPNGPVRYGFKAQDVLALEGDSPVIIDNEDPEKLRMVDQHLIAVLVNAVQELSATVTAQAARIEALEVRP